MSPLGAARSLPEALLLYRVAWRTLPEGLAITRGCLPITSRSAVGRTSQARALLEMLRCQDRDNPEVHYWLGRSYFKDLWVQDGLDAYREAITLDPEYRNRADLIESAATGLDNDSHHYAVARFLVRDIGRPAGPRFRPLPLPTTARKYASARRGRCARFPDRLAGCARRAWSRRAVQDVLDNGRRS